MKGKIFNIYETFICEAYSEQAWDLILEASNKVHQIDLISPKSDLDSDFKAIIVATSRVLEMAIPDLLGLFGLYAFPYFKKYLPSYFGESKDVLEMILKIPEVLVVDIKKALPEVYLPEVSVERLNEKEVELKYHSRRKMCEFLEGLILACANSYGEEVKITHHRCMHYGHDFCSIAICKV